jgi:formate hydrogenlyase subunit 6/NADH:ubiquinone oxidoreductase subunit I
MERSLTLVFYPVASFFGGLVGNMRPAVFTDSALALATFGLIIGLGLIAPRFWCRNLCPLGGLLGLLSKLSLFKFGFSPDCRDCGLCAKVCPTGAIALSGDSKSSTGNRESKMALDPAECINCFACRYRCADRSARYGLHPAPARLDIGRREAIISIGSAIVAAPLAASLLHRRTSSRLIRPPGALPEGEFLTACLRCGRCMKACPTGALQPSLLESGVNGLWSPRVVPRVGGCEKNCNLCGQVCPTMAIRRLPLEEKSYARIGTAVIDRGRCIAWEQDRVCLVCDEACQYNAIGAYNETIRGTSLLRPFVDERICVGCGLCESRCPIDGPAAIQVHSFGEERKRTGSYKTEEKARLRTCGERAGSEDIPSGFILDDK